MIVVDIETSGIDMQKSGIWQIGAIELENLDNFFFEDGRIDDEDMVNLDSLKITGMSEEELRDKKKQSQRQLLSNFFRWAVKIKNNDCICQNPVFDWSFLNFKAEKYGIRFPLFYRTLDLHSIAQLRHHQLNGKFLIKNNLSDMGLSNIIAFCGMKDGRIVHNAIEDARITGECFWRIVRGESLFSDYYKYEIPKYLVLK